MRVRVTRYFDVVNAVWVHRVETWHEPLFGWIVGEPDSHWWPWPYSPLRNSSGLQIFTTPDEAQARRIAKDLSAGREAMPGVLCEFSNGVEVEATSSS